MTQHFTGSVLLEYDDIPSQSSRSSNTTAQYNIKDLFYGTGGVIYRGAFYYHRLILIHLSVALAVMDGSKH